MQRRVNFSYRSFLHVHAASSRKDREHITPLFLLIKQRRMAPRPQDSRQHLVLAASAVAEAALPLLLYYVIKDGDGPNADCDDVVA
jgi:hypothetical protein